MYEISKHAKERYAERIMSRDHKADVARYVIENDEKIQTDVNKMIEYGKEIYGGKQVRDGKKIIVKVILCGCWIVLCDAAKNIVITLYKVDLGLGDDFNGEYVDRMTSKLESAKAELEEVNTEIKLENEHYNAAIAENEELINDYRQKVNKLMELNDAYKDAREKNAVKYEIAEEKVIEILNAFIGKKVF